MENKSLFQKYYARVRKHAIVKSLLCGLLVGFSADLIAALATWFAAYNGLWISLAAFVAFTLGATALFYFFLFRPTAGQIARMVDGLGLEERIITMMELEKDESYIALRQREDAKEKLQTVSHTQIKFHVSAVIVACLCVVGVLGVTATTVTTLSAHGIVPTPGQIDDIINPPEPEYVAVSYMVEEGGYVKGEAEQIVAIGESATPVLAVADDGWAFAQWSDGLTDPSRHDIDVQGEIIVSALFLPVGEDGEGDGDGEPGDEPTDAPEDGQDGQDGNGTDGSGGGAGGRYEEINQIIDGKTYYRDILKQDDYMEQLLELLAEDAEMPTELRELLEAYLNSIA